MIKGWAVATQDLLLRGRTLDRISASAKVLGQECAWVLSSRKLVK